MSRGSIYSLGAVTRKGLALFWTALLLSTLLMQYLAVAAPTKVQANSTGDKNLGGFEIDANLYSGNANPSSLDGADWAQGSSGQGLLTKPTIVDPIGNADTTNFSVGSKEGDAPSTWQGGTGTASPKDDMGNVFVGSQLTPPGPNGHLWAYLGVERASNSGTTFFDFEFNQKPNVTNAYGISVPNRTAGDILLVAQQQGSGSFTISGTVQKWTGSAWGAPITPSSSQFYGLSNDGSIPPGPWTDAIAAADNGAIPERQFAEMGFDMTSLGIVLSCPSQGFGEVNVRTRSSITDQASLKDYASAPIDIPANCATLSWQKQDDSGNPNGGATFTVTPNPFTGTGAGVDIADLTSGSPASVTSDQDNRPGFFKLINVVPNVTYTIAEKTAPAGFLVDPTTKTIKPDVFQDASVSYIWVDPAYSHPTLTTALTGGTSSGGTSALTVDLGNSGNTATFSDTASFGSTNANHEPTGTVTYTLYSDSSCKTAVDSGDVTINANGTIPASKTFSVTGTGTWYVVASYAGDDYNAAASSGCADEVVTVVKPNIVASKSVDLTSANPGDTLHYTITIQNNGTGAASGVTLADDISALLAHGTLVNGSVHATAGTATFDGVHTINWTGNLASGASVSVTYAIALDAVFPSGTTNLPNTAVVTGRGSNCAADSTDTNCSTNTVVTAAPILNAVKTVKVGDGAYSHSTTAQTGDTLGYRIVVSNTGNADATGQTVTDTLSSTLLANSAPFDASTCSPACTYAAGTITWSGLNIPAGQQATLTFSVTLKPTFPAGTTQLPNAVVMATSENCSTGAAADCTTTTTVTAEPKLTLTKQVSIADGALTHSGPANPGDVLSYRITLTNLGNAAATGETVTDDLSSLLAHATWNNDATASSGSASLVGSALTWSGITVQAGSYESLTFSVTLDTAGWTAGQTDLPNTALEANTSNCASAQTATADCTATVSVTTGTDVRITKSVNPTTIPGGSGSAVAYTLVISNNGTGGTNGHVLVTDQDFPAFYAISGVVCSPTNATCDAAHLTGAGIDLGTLAGGASVTITVSGTASPNNTTDVGSHVNTAYACEQLIGGGQACVHAPATLTVTLTHMPAIHIVKSADKTALAYPGGSVTYTYVVTNTGNVPLSNVTVADDKCSAVSFVGGDANNNQLLDLTETWTFTCTMNITATTVNIATATGHDGDVAVTDSDTKTVQVLEPEATPTPAPTATPNITLPPTSTVDGSTPSSQSGSGLLMLLVAIAGITLLAGYLIPAPARSRRRNRRS